MTNKGIKKVLISFAIFTTIFVNTTSFCTAVTSDKVLAYEQELEQVKIQERENMEKLTGVEKELAQYSYEIAELDSEMVTYGKKLTELQEKTDDVNDKISEYEAALQDSSQLYNSAEDMYITRLRAIYENGIPTIWDLLFASKGISDFFSKLNIYQSILDYDRSLVSNMQNQKEYINFIKKDIEDQKLQLEQLTYDTQKSTEALENLRSQKEAKVNSLQNSKSELTATSEILTQKKKEAQQKIEDEIARILQEEQQKQQNGGGASTTFPGGQFVWPVAGFNIITTRFGEIYNLVDPAGSAHTGCDIGGTNINNTPIVAIESGTVSVAKYSNYGYGNYVMINHGKCTDDNNNYISLYGHCTSLAVSVGQKVNKGDVIGYVGSTGNSTGPHLHLEVRVNGKITDPLQYYPGLTFVYR